MEEEIDVETLIALVGQKPAIWDKRCHDHQSRAIMTDSWRSVAADMKQGFDQLSPSKKNAYVKFLMKKWRNIRDQYAKTAKKAADQRKLGVPEKAIKRYIYEAELFFLKKNNGSVSSFFCGETGNSDVTGDDDSSNVDISTFCNVELRTDHQNDGVLTEPSRKRQKSDPVGRYRRADQEDDPKLLFFKSILPSVEDFTVDEVLQLQSRIINTIQAIKRSRVQPRSSYVGVSSPSYAPWLPDEATPRSPSYAPPLSPSCVPPRSPSYAPPPSPSRVPPRSPSYVAEENSPSSVVVENSPSHVVEENTDESEVSNNSLVGSWSDSC